MLIGVRSGDVGSIGHVRLIRYHRSLKVALVAPLAGMATDALRAELAADPAVTFVEPNWVFRAPRGGGLVSTHPDLDDAGAADGPAQSFGGSGTDPELPRQWHLSKIRATGAWKTATGAGVTVAVIDTGIDLDHPDLRDNLVPGANMLEENAPPRDDDGHGTHVAGLIAAIAGNAAGGAGVAPGAKVMPIRAISETGGDSDSIARAIVYAADQQVQVINLSLSSRRQSKTVEQAVTYALWRGSAIVASMGNDGESGSPRVYPAAYPGVIAVGALDSRLRVPAWSSRGDWISLAAPGKRIWSTFPTYDCGMTRWAREHPDEVPADWKIQGQFAAISGTSQASPLVAGVVALLREQRPDLTPEQVRRVLLQSARDVDTTGFDPASGAGLLDAGAALALP